ncbi:retrovirus-related pol polyprotein from transposon TNT 1-94 [Tanacetum coccineum]
MYATGPTLLRILNGPMYRGLSFPRFSNRMTPFRGDTFNITRSPYWNSKGFIHNHKDHLGKFDAKADDGYFLGYSSVSKDFRVYNIRRQQIEETYHVTFDEKDDPSRQYQVDYDVSYYIIPHGRSLTEITQENHVPGIIAPNEPEILHTKDTEGPSDPINTEGIHEQNVQNDQMITQPTNVPSRSNAEDRWLRDQHIELVNIIGDPGEGVLTRSMAAKFKAASASECLFANFLSKIEPKKVSEALKHPGWINAMQEELNQFYRNKVWTLVPLPYRKIAIGYSQEEGIDYDETFAPVERMEAIRIFIAFSTYMNFKVYQMDVKSAFLKGKLREEVYVKQPPAFESSEFPDYVCKLDKALYGLKQAPKACSLVKTLMVPPNNLGLDLAGKSVNETSYRGMIGSLVYLTATRPDIQFSTVLCARYQSNLKESHLIAVKRILRYLKGTLTLGLYYPKCLDFDLKGYSDSDYAGCNMDRKSTSAKAEYVATIVCCASILWMKSQLSDYDIHYKMVPIFCDNTSSIAISNNPILYSRTKHVDIRYHFIRDHILKGDIELHFIPTEYQLADIFTKPLDKLVYQNFFREFWSTAVAFDHFPSTDEPEKCPLKEFLIKFSVSNGHFGPIRSSVLNGNYSSTEQVNSTQQLLAYSLITKTEVDIWEIIYNDLVTKLLNKYRLKYASYPRFISCALQVLLGSEYTQDKEFRDSVSLPLLVAKTNKGKSQTMAPTLPKLQGPEASGALSKKRKKPKSKRPPTKTKESPPKPTESPRAPGKQITLDKDITSTTSNEGTAKTMPRSEGSLRDKDSGGSIPPADMEPIHTPVADPSGTSAKYQVDETQSIRLRYQSLTKNNGKTSSKVEPDTEPLKLQTYADIQAFLFSDDELDKDSDEQEVLAVGDDMDEDPQDDKEVRTLSPKQDQPKPSHVQESVLDSSSPDLKKFNNILPLTERQLIKYLWKMSRAPVDQYYNENIAHRDQTDKLVEASMSSLDRSSTTISDLYKGLHVITGLLKDISNVVKYDPATNQKLNEATETFIRISSNVTEVLPLVKGFDFSALLSAVKSLRAHAVKQEKASTAWMKKDTSEMKPMMTELYAAFQGHPSSAPSGSVTPTLALTDIQLNVEGENANTTATEKPPSHTEGETEEPRLAILISSIPSTIIKWLLKALDEAPYEFKNFVPKGSTIPRLQTAEDLEGDDLLLHDAEMEVMNMILLYIPNEIYNSVDACTLAKDINNKNFPTVTINTKFLNSLQPEWLKYVTQVCLPKQLTVDSFDDLFDYLQQFEKLVNASRAKKLEKSHDPLALVANTGSSSRQTSSYYVTHPTSVVDYDDKYQNSGNTGRNNRRAYVQEEVVEGMNAPNETRNVQRTLHTPSSGNTSTVNATTRVEKDIMLGIFQSQGMIFSLLMLQGWKKLKNSVQTYA